MLAHLRAVPWRLDQAAFKAWRQGLTGYPLVDAGARVAACSVCRRECRVLSCGVGAAAQQPHQQLRRL
jgi:hypothetical protein